MTNPNTPDPFDQPASVPSLSFKDAPVGLAYQGTVTRLPEVVQSRDYETGELAFWPDGNPKMSVVLHLNVNGEERSLWAARPSAMFTAIAEAQKTAGARIKLGDTLVVAYIGDKPNEKNPKLNPIKQYQVGLQPADPFAAAAAQAAAQPAQAELPVTPVVSSAPGAAVSYQQAAPAAAPVAAPAPTAPPVAPPVAAAPVDPAAALVQIKALITAGLPDAQIAAAVPQFSADAIAAVRAAG